MKKLVPLILMGAAPFVAAESVNSPWSGEGDLAFSKSSGNTRNESLLAKLMVAYTDGRWTHSGQLEAVNASEDDSRSAEAYVLRGKTQYALDDRYYAFGNGRYQDDRFSGYEYQASLVGGVGVHVIATERALFDLEAGAGYRRSEEQDTGETFNEPVLLLASKYHRELTETTRFENDLSVESGADNTYGEAVFGLRVKINASLGLKVAYTVKHNTDVPDGTKNTDTLTSVGLNYSF
ncbi:MAG: DUF481 domain-containing protein [Porticoccaceae bacterium]|nr:DUF481 domain-containing protein [Porticoccaceae bacterium]MEA3300322.1 DUF481 domain-containing protein [Pseudomonadota bacterium]HLS97546.1 DUF481 domain-containing protein [Porticoccaceae bacterium]